MVQIMSSLSTSRKIYEQNFDFPEEGLFLWFINMSYDTLPPKIALDDISKPWNLPGVKIRQGCKLNRYIFNKYIYMFINDQNSSNLNFISICRI